MAAALPVAVVTGGHSYEVPSFQRLFRSLPGLEATIQHMDDFASSPQAVRESYGAVVFYIMLRPGPTDEGLPWYCGKPLTALSELGSTAQGIVVLHHALLAYPEWPVWDEIVGVTERGESGYYFGETVTSQLADPDHPITRGLSPWTMVDETYTMTEADPADGNHLLLTYDHPRSVRTIAWTRQFGHSRVFCYEAGHDNQTWPDANFREVLRRGLLWSAGRE